MKATIFHNNEHTNIITSDPDITPEECRANLRSIHTTITSQYLNSRNHNKVTNTTPLDIHPTEQTLPRHLRTRLAQLRTNKSPLLHSYLHKLNPNSHTPLCPLCSSHTHDTNHLFHCSNVPTQHHTTSLWNHPTEAAEVIWHGRPGLPLKMDVCSLEFPRRRFDNNNELGQKF